MKNLVSAASPRFLGLAIALVMTPPSPRARAAESPVADPAPPAVAAPSTETREAVAFDRLTVHREPAPLSPGATVSDWPHFLGPAYDRNTVEGPLLEQWSGEGPPLVWEIECGQGYAAPVVAGDYLVAIHRVGEREAVECLDPVSGKRYWLHAFDVQHRQSYGVEDSARASPTIDGDYVYTIGVTSLLHCIHLASGSIVWQRDLAAEFAVPRGFFGKGSSPLVCENNLVLNLGGKDGRCVAAFDKKTGRLNWITSHPWLASYASPIAAPVHGSERVFVFAGGQDDPPAGGLLCIDPESGKLNSAVPWRSDEFASVNAASPVMVGTDGVFMTEAYGHGGALVRFDPGFRAEIAWAAPRFGSQFSTPIHYEGHLYGFDGQSDAGAALVCYDAGSGREVWRESGLRLGRGSLLRTGDRFLCLGEHGELLRLRLSPRECEVVAHSRLFSAPESFTPLVLSKGLLYVRRSEREVETGAPPSLLCYDLRKETAP